MGVKSDNIRLVIDGDIYESKNIENDFLIETETLVCFPYNDAEYQEYLEACLSIGEKQKSISPKSIVEFQEYNFCKEQWETTKEFNIYNIKYNPFKNSSKIKCKKYIVAE